LGTLTGLANMYIGNNPGLCGDIPAGVTPDAHSTHCPIATGGTLLGSMCAASSPTPDFTSSPTSLPGEYPLKENWFRKRDVARKDAFPQKYSWFSKQAKRAAENATTK